MSHLNQLVTKEEYAQDVAITACILQINVYGKKIEEIEQCFAPCFWEKIKHRIKNISGKESVEDNFGPETLKAIRGLA